MNVKLTDCRITDDGIMKRTEFGKTKFPVELEELYATFSKLLTCEHTLNGNTIENNLNDPRNMYCQYGFNGVSKEGIKVSLVLHYLGHVGKYGIGVSVLKDTDDDYEWRRIASSTDPVFSVALGNVMEQFDIHFKEFAKEVEKD